MFILAEIVRDVDPLVKLLGNWLSEINFYSIFVRIILAVLLGGLIGIERAFKKHEAGFRTNILVCIGATMTTFCNQFICESFGTGDMARLGAGVISGVGFLGAGTILLTSRNQIRGLTTAAGLWTCACLGISIGLGFYTVAIGGCLAIMLVLFLLPRIEAVINNKTPYLTMHVEFENITETKPDYLKDFMIFLRNHNTKIYAVEKNQAFLATKLAVYSISVRINYKPSNVKITQDELIQEIRNLEYIFYCEKIN